LAGGWRYMEHEWTARQGDFVYETAGSRHSFQSEPGADTELFVLLDGSLEFLDEAGNVAAVEDWRTMLQRMEAHCKAHGLPVPELSEFPRAPHG
jgi:2,4'-dihydroxyacetophenone dioxygenase